jgi:DUF4097 and DUF4098 domain-containing protein YvlB
VGLVTAVCTVLLAGCSVSFPVGKGPGGGAELTTDTTTTDHPPVTRLMLDSDAGEVSVRAGAASQVTATRRYAGAEPLVEQTVEGDVLTVTARCPDGADPCAVDLEVTVPAVAAVRVRVGAGDVTVQGLSGEVDLEAGTGDLRGTGLAGPTATARSGAGAVDLRHTTAPEQVVAEAGAGDVSVTVPAAEVYRVEANSAVGEVRVEVADDPGASRRVSARSGAGDVTVLGG